MFVFPRAAARSPSRPGRRRFREGGEDPFLVVDSARWRTMDDDCDELSRARRARLPPPMLFPPPTHPPRPRNRRTPKSARGTRAFGRNRTQRKPFDDVPRPPPRGLLFDELPKRRRRTRVWARYNAKSEKAIRPLYHRSTSTPYPYLDYTLFPETSPAPSPGSDPKRI